MVQFASQLRGSVVFKPKTMVTDTLRISFADFVPPNSRPDAVR